ncbi:hypothetical protein [Sulfitobacter sp. EhC04]|uniref:hypothetical protein n=1 Tax=Sulfitobacter sp. EhC04 TaxID=1849168 RepID=UPI0010FEEA0B|nr:hypothetical protein [Sulfitobacter sp. EhC04]
MTPGITLHNGKPMSFGPDLPAAQALAVTGGALTAVGNTAAARPSRAGARPPAADTHPEFSKTPARFLQRNRPRYGANE